MDDAQTLEFEAFILSRPDWQEMVRQVDECYEQACAEQWQEDLDESLQLLSEQKAAHHPQPNRRKEGFFKGFSWQWTVWPAALAFSVGAVMFMPENTALKDELLLSQTHGLTLGETRSSDNLQKVMIAGQQAQTLALHLPLEGDLLDNYTVDVLVDDQLRVSQQVQPDLYGSIRLSLTGRFSDGQQLALLLRPAEQQLVIKTYRLQVVAGH